VRVGDEPYSRAHHERNLTEAAQQLLHQKSLEPIADVSSQAALSEAAAVAAMKRIGAAESGQT
jgi:hypothetical protein